MAGVLLLPAGLNPVTAGGRPVADAEAASAAQQDNIVRGTVLDERGETLVGVSVIIQGTSTGTATDAKGRFEIRAKRGDVLVVSSIGFITENVTVTGNTLTVTLKEDSQMLGEVVVTALGLPKQARQVGYATTRVSTDEIERTNTINRCAAVFNIVQPVCFANSSIFLVKFGFEFHGKNASSHVLIAFIPNFAHNIKGPSKSLIKLIVSTTEMSQTQNPLTP